MTETIDFAVSGEEKIHCAGCEQRIDQALRRVDGIRSVRASAQTQQVTVQFDPREVGREQIRTKLERMGYELVGGTP